MKTRKMSYYMWKIYKKEGIISKKERKKVNSKPFFFRCFGHFINEKRAILAKINRGNDQDRSMVRAYSLHCYLR